MASGLRTVRSTTLPHLTTQQAKCTSQTGNNRVYLTEAVAFKLFILFNMFSRRFLCLANLLMSPYTEKAVFLPRWKGVF